MNKNILKYFVKTIIGGVLLVYVLIAMITVGIFTYEIFSGKVSKEEFMILDEISEKIKEGEYPLEELTENDVSITLSQDESNNMYNLELAKSVATENIFLDDEANIIYIEKQDNSMALRILMIFFIICLLIALIFCAWVIVGNVTSLIFEIRIKISEFRVRKIIDKELQDTKE